MMKLFAPLAALAFVAGAAARTCESTSGTVSTLSITANADCCTPSGGVCDPKNREFTPRDIDVVTVQVKKQNPSDATDYSNIIAQFQLSNAVDQDQASGSLDNIEAGFYKVQVTASTESALKFVDGTCAEGTSVLFTGESAAVEIKGDGSSSQVSIFMSSCHPGINFAANGVPTPVYPSFVSSVSITSDRAVLGANSNVDVSVTVTNVNQNSAGEATLGANFGRTAVAAYFTTNGDTRGDTPNWTVKEEGSDTTNDVSRDDEEFFIATGAGGAHVYTFNYNSGGATNTYTTEITFTGVAYSGDKDGRQSTLSTSKIKESGSISLDFIVAPVGDLDLEIVYFSGLRLGHNSISATKSAHTSNGENFIKQERATDQCTNERNAEAYAFVIPDSIPTIYNIDFEADTLYALTRTMRFTVTTTSGGCTGSIKTGQTTFASSEDEYSTSFDLTVQGNSEQSQTATLPFPVLVKVTPDAELSTLSHETCELKVEGKTIGQDAESNQIEKDISASLKVVIAKTAYVCNKDYIGSVPGSVEYDDSVAAQINEKSCPLLKTIMWRSTDHFSNGPACGKQSGTQDISFCAMYTGDANDFTKDDFSLEIYDLRYSNVVETFNKDTTADFTILVDDSEGALNPCNEATTELGSGESAFQQDVTKLAVIFKITNNAFTGKSTIGGLCDANGDTKFGARIKASGGSSSTDGTTGICTDSAIKSAYGGNVENDKTIFCPNYKKTEKTESGINGAETCHTANIETTEAPARRKLLSSSPGCPANSPFTCPADNRMPFDIKIEDGRLTVSMDTKAIGDKKVVINANPIGLLPKRSRFIASDFAGASTSWTAALKAKLDFVFQDESMRQNLKPGASAQSLVACCGFSLGEAQALEAAMSSIVKAEDAQVFRPTITIGGGNTGSTNTQQQQTTSTQTTSTHTTEKSSDDSSSGGSLLVVVAVAAVLVLVAVIALAIFTVKSNKQSQRVVDLRGGNDKQSSWQKGGAMESDF